MIDQQLCGTQPTAAVLLLARQPSRDRLSRAPSSLHDSKPITAASESSNNGQVWHHDANVQSSALQPCLSSQHDHQHVAAPHQHDTCTQRVTQDMCSSLSHQDAVQQLSQDMQELLSTVKAQQEALHQQQQEIHNLRQTVAQLQQQPQQQQSVVEAARELDWSSNGSVRPFDAQKAALLDRRGRGMFDARFHSTSRCV